MSNTSLSWGDTVRVMPAAPEHFRPGEAGAVCGLWELDTSEKAQRFGEKVGIVMILVEFQDGVGIEIPDYLLEKLD